MTVISGSQHAIGCEVAKYRVYLSEKAVVRYSQVLVLRWTRSVDVCGLFDPLTDRPLAELGRADGAARRLLAVITRILRG